MKKKTIIPVNSDLDQYAKNLRKNMTNEEKTIWYDFLNKITPRFHRQKIIGSYIVDFYRPKLKLVIEIDGVQHYDIANSIYDNERTQFFEGLGLSVIRFDNFDIKKDFGTVVYDITTHCEEKARMLGVQVRFPDDV